MPKLCTSSMMNKFSEAALICLDRRRHAVRKDVLGKPKVGFRARRRNVRSYCVQKKRVLPFLDNGIPLSSIDDSSCILYVRLSRPRRFYRIYTPNESCIKSR